MSLNCGIVGLPNVGKSTIFNAMTSAGAEAANYPFCTIEPNTGVVFVPDERINILGKINKSEKVIPTAIEFVDIAGLVKGAATGEGLGNQFLSHIRNVDAIIHVVRCFEDSNVTHVEGSVDPVRDVALIETELMLSDLASVDKRLDKARKAAKSGTKEMQEELQGLEIAKKYLDEGIMLTELTNEDEKKLVSKLALITAKPVVFVANIGENELGNPNQHAKALESLATSRGNAFVYLSGQVESEISVLGEEEKKEFMDALDIKESGLETLARASYQALNLITFFTSGPKETRAWTISKGDNAVDAAGQIHTDFAKGFIRAEVIGYNDFITCGGELKSKEQGKLRSEGKTYLMTDGDVVHFRFNV